MWPTITTIFCRIILPVFHGSMDFVHGILGSVPATLAKQSNGNMGTATFLFAFLLCFQQIVRDCYLTLVFWNVPTYILTIGLTEWLLSKNLPVSKIPQDENTQWSIRLAQSIVHKLSLPVTTIILQILLLVPVIGYPVYVLGNGIVYAVYVFDTAWTTLGTDLASRREYVNRNTIYVFAFGLPFAFVTHYLPAYHALVLSSAMYHFGTIGVTHMRLYPDPACEGPRIQIFWVCRRLVIWALNLVLHRCSRIHG